MDVPTPTSNIPRKGRVLLVDEDVDMREILAEFLREEGYSVGTATTVLEGAARLEQKPYELVICDFKVSGASGLEFIETVLRKYPSTSVILLTEVPEPAVVQDAQIAGRFLVIRKPLDVTQLLAWVKHGVISSGLFRVLRRRNGEKDASPKTS